MYVKGCLSNIIKICIKYNYNIIMAECSFFINFVLFFLATTIQADCNEQVGGMSRGHTVRNKTETDESETNEQIASLIGCVIVYSRHLHQGEKLTSY